MKAQTQKHFMLAVQRFKNEDHIAYDTYYNFFQFIFTILMYLFSNKLKVDIA